MANSLTPALALAPGAEGLLPLLERLAELEKRNGGLRPENARKVIDAVAPFVEKQERDPCERIYDLLPALKDEDPSRYREILVATLTDEERELCQKMSAVQRAVPPPSRARSAEKSLTPALSRNGYETQLRDQQGRWRKMVWRKADPRPRFGGVFFK